MNIALPEIIYFIVLLAAVFVLVHSGVIVMRSLVRLARLWGVSEYVLSFVLLSFATTLPEFMVGINAAIAGNPIIALGNIIGSSMLNLGLALGLAAIIAGGMRIDKTIAAHDAWFTFVLGIAPLVLLLDGTLSRVDGGILIVLFFAYLAKLSRGQELFQKGKSFWLSRNNESGGDGDGIITPRHFFREIGLFVVAITLLIISANVIVNTAVGLSSYLQIPEFVIGTLLIAVGTSLPEISFMLRAVLSRHPDISLGNLVGATAFNSTWILGVTSIIMPIQIQGELSSFFIPAAFLAITLFVANVFMRTGLVITRKEGVGLLLLYALFVVSQIMI